MSKRTDALEFSEYGGINVVQFPDSTGSVNVESGVYTDTIGTNTIAKETIVLEKSLEITEATPTVNPVSGNVTYYSENGTLHSRDASGTVKEYTDTINTKGDLATYSTVPQKLPVGQDGYVLTADSTEPTGLKWSESVGGPVVTQTEKGFSSLYNTQSSDIEVTDTPLVYDNYLYTNNSGSNVGDSGFVNILEDGEYYIEATPTFVKTESGDITTVESRIQKEVNGLWTDIPAAQATVPLWLQTGVQTCTAGSAIVDNSQKGDRYRTVAKRDEPSSGGMVSGNLFYSIRESVGNSSITSSYSNVPFDVTDTSSSLITLQSNVMTFGSSGVYFVTQNVNVSMTSDSVSRFNTRWLLNGVEVLGSVSYATVPIMGIPTINITRETFSIPCSMYINISPGDTLSVQVRELSSNNVGILIENSVVNVYLFDTNQRYQYNLQNYNLTNTNLLPLPVAVVPQPDITQGTPFSVNNGVFTCQSTGVYLFVLTLHHFYNGDNNEDCFSRIQPRINGSNSTRRVHFDNLGITDGKNTSCAHWVYSLNTGDTIEFRAERFETNSFNNTDFMTVDSTSTIGITRFSNAQITSRFTNNSSSFTQTYINVQQNSSNGVSQGNVNYSTGTYTVTNSKNAFVLRNYNFRSNSNTVAVSVQTRELLDDIEVTGSNVYRTTADFRNDNLGRSSVYYTGFFTADGNTQYRGQVRTTNFISTRYDDTQLTTLILLDVGTASTGDIIQLEPLTSGLQIHKGLGNTMSNFYSVVDMPVGSTESVTDLLSTRVNNLQLTLQNDSITFDTPGTYLLYVSSQIHKTGLFNGVVKHFAKLNNTTFHTWETISFLDLDGDINKGSGWTKIPLTVTANDILSFTHIESNSQSGLKIVSFNVIITQTPSDYHLRTNTSTVAINSTPSVIPFNTLTQNSSDLSSDSTTLSVETPGWYTFGFEFSMSNTISDSCSVSGYFEVSADLGTTWYVPNGSWFNNIITVNSHLSGSITLAMAKYSTIRVVAFVEQNQTINLVGNNIKFWGALQSTDTTKFLISENSFYTTGIQTLLTNTLFSDGRMYQVTVSFDTDTGLVAEELRFIVKKVENTSSSQTTEDNLFSIVKVKGNSIDTMSTTIEKYLKLEKGSYTLKFINNISNSIGIGSLVVKINSLL